MRFWILLAYNVPRQPSANRVYVWRKLKKLGAVLLQDAVWVLPATPQTREHFQWLATEIKELKGESTLWEAKLLAPGQEEDLLKHFEGTIDRAFREIFRELSAREPDLAALSRRYQQLSKQDFFHSAIGERVRAALISPRTKGKRRS